MFKKLTRIVLPGVIVFGMVMAGCKSQYDRLKASNDNTKKYQEAIKYYNKKDYNKALGLFEDLAPRYRGRESAEDLFYYYAYTNYRLKDYTSARFHFKNFADTYPSSPRAEECRFIAAYCFYLDSPIYSLDQENTDKAIEALQLFINLYPKSDRVTEASKLIQNLRDKLEQKAYANAKLYLTIGDYQSAVIAFNNTLRDYPDTKYAEELEYLTIEAQYKYARISLERKQQERYEQAITYADQFVDKYPNSKFLKSANEYIKDSRYGIERARRVIAEAETDQKLAEKLAKKDSTNTAQPPSIKDRSNQKIPQ
ncbi:MULTISPECIES: outer membrane protein assembly factor BamD [unclassified Mucilaginibacter]|uniref:outer membrane protein assembly factor BamD n=1 Tax=unclassified Mucilaginibacter TaxID=2617802 RepID=UPI00095DCC5D|nr:MULTISPECIES: outer membrane protein assembly factor BamD [unclassified Mucilaginibacter]OJW12895.1 MAG: outer membrane protein assembly factor BamD [Mucilaginibacter sp. 44-25]PAW91960.1 outer membrane protein assembly factor BamD [Mucilaginibacter sp. MD40]PLW91573.1 MAG: outer membrane protein assembly factor BamD [Mucilaginibacter sp.]